MRTRLFLLSGLTILALAVCLVAPNHAAAEDIGGLWSGQYEGGGRLFRIQMFLQHMGGQIGGQVALLDQGGQPLPIAQGQQGPDGAINLMFAMPSPYGQMLPVGLSLRLNGAILEGYYQDSTGNNGRMQLQRETPPPVNQAARQPQPSANPPSPQPAPRPAKQVSNLPARQVDILDPALNLPARRARVPAGREFEYRVTPTCLMDFAFAYTIYNPTSDILVMQLPPVCFSYNQSNMLTAQQLASLQVGEQRKPETAETMMLEVIGKLPRDTFKNVKLIRTWRNEKDYREQKQFFDRMNANSSGNGLTFGGGIDTNEALVEYRLNGKPRILKLQVMVF